MGPCHDVQSNSTPEPDGRMKKDDWEQLTGQKRLCLKTWYVHYGVIKRQNVLLQINVFIVRKNVNILIR